MHAFIVQSKDLEGRWDPAFHEVNQLLGPEAQELERQGTYTPEVILDKVLALPSNVWQVLKPLSRGTSDHLSEANVRAILKEYPYLGAVLIAKEAPAITRALNEKIALIQESVDILNALAQPASLTPSTHNPSRPKG